MNCEKSAKKRIRYNKTFSYVRVSFKMIKVSQIYNNRPFNKFVVESLHPYVFKRTDKVRL